MATLAEVEPGQVWSVRVNGNYTHVLVQGFTKNYKGRRRLSLLNLLTHNVLEKTATFLRDQSPDPEGIMERYARKRATKKVEAATKRRMKKERRAELSGVAELGRLVNAYSDLNGKLSAGVLADVLGRLPNSVIEGITAAIHVAALSEPGTR